MRKLVGFLVALVCTLAVVSHTGHNSGAVNATKADDQPEVESAANSVEDETAPDEELESEMQLKRMLMYVTPLMAILRSKPGQSSARSTRSETPRKSPYDRSSYSDRESYVDDYDRSGYDRYGYDRYGYDRNNFDRYGNDRNGYDGGGGYGGGGGYCCQQKDDLRPLLALLGLAGLLLYLVLIASTTTTATGRRKRFIPGDENEIVDLSDYDNIGKV